MKKIFISAFVVMGFFLSLPAFSAELNLIVGDYTLVEKKRVSRTDIQYTYNVDILNNDTVLEAVNVTASLSSTSPNTTIIDGTLNVDSVPASGNVTSTDTFSIRQNRRVPFDPSSLSWTFTGVVLPPDPGDEGKETLAGIDLDNDGVRDDIQRYIVLTYQSESSDILNALFNHAKILQAMLLEANDKGKTIQNFSTYSKSTDCIEHHIPSDVINIMQALDALLLNTEERYIQDVEASKNLSGGFYSSGELNRDLSKGCK